MFFGAKLESACQSSSVYEKLVNCVTNCYSSAAIVLTLTQMTNFRLQTERVCRQQFQI